MNLKKIARQLEGKVDPSVATVVITLADYAIALGNTMDKIATQNLKLMQIMVAIRDRDEKLRKILGPLRIGDETIDDILKTGERHAKALGVTVGSVDPGADG